MATTEMRFDNFESYLLQSISNYRQKIIEEEMNKAIETATKEIRRRTLEAIDMMALNISREFEIQTMRDRVIITVRKMI